MSSLIDIVGFLAASLTTIAFLPQVLKVWKTRSARDISLGMYSLFATGVLLWLIYGILIGSGPVIAANIITLALAITMIVMKLKFG